MGFAESFVKIVFWARVRKAKRIGEAAQLIGEGRAQETLEILEKMQRRIPPYVGHLFFLTKARAHDELGQLEEAEQSYLAAAFAKQGASIAYIHLAVLHGRQREFEKARDWLRRIREDDEADEELLEQAAQLEEMIDDVETGRRLESMARRAGAFAELHGFDGLGVDESLSRLDAWVEDDIDRATEERDELACYLGELALSAGSGHWVLSLSLEESYVESERGRFDPFERVAERLAGKSLFEGCLAD